LPSVPEGRVVPVEPALLGVAEAARYLGLGRTEVFILLREQRIRSIKRGRRRLVPRSELDRFVQEALNEDE
jgi:excisionase family DNA binding protein